MRKLNKMTEPVKTVGLDVGEKKSLAYCLGETGDFVGKALIPTTQKGIAKWFGDARKARVAIKAGTHCHWINWALEELGHTVIIANSRKLELIAKHEQESDDRDARMLAELGRSDRTISLLAPIRPKSEVEFADCGTIKMRGKLVQARAELVLNVRGIAKVAGYRLPATSPSSFHSVDLAELPDGIAHAIELMLPAVETMTQQIGALDKEIERIAKERYPQTKLLRQIRGVGPITSLLFVLTIGEASRFKRSRDVGAYLGLVPRRQPSGDGDRMMRSLLVQCAHYMLGPLGEDSDLRRFGERIAQRGGRDQKKRAVIAVARKLAVVMHRLWVAGEVYDPLRNAKLSSQ